MKIIFTNFFKNYGGFVDMIVNNISSPKKNNINKVKLYYKGEYNEELNEIKSMINLDKNGPLIINISKLYNKFDDPNQFFSFGRILSGKIKIFIIRYNKIESKSKNSRRILFFKQ
jgi:translation elongation factor EF-G